MAAWWEDVEKRAVAIGDGVVRGERRALMGLEIGRALESIVSDLEDAIVKPMEE